MRPELLRSRSVEIGYFASEERHRRSDGTGACILHVHYAVRMVVNVQIRNVPEDLVAELKARAAARRQSLSAYLLGELEQIAATPPLDDWLRERLAAPRRHMGVTGAELVAEGRRDNGWDD
jgi:antitoxin FitA